MKFTLPELNPCTRARGHTHTHTHIHTHTHTHTNTHTHTQTHILVVCLFIHSFYLFTVLTSAKGCFSVSPCSKTDYIQS